MRVKIVPGQRRQGAGKRPARENRRAWLPQQARFCPVLEDASKTGYLIYPPLHDNESFQVRYQDNNVFRLTFYVGDDRGMRAPAFVVDIRPSAGTGGLDHTEVVFLEEKTKLTTQMVQQLLDALVTNVNSPPGGIGIRGAFDFITPEGWDTVYTGVVNELQQPAVPVLTARVETDWYPQNTEFRHVLQRGDVVSVAGSSPIGQVFFVPREDVRMEDASEEEREWFSNAQRAYWEERATKERTTNFGATYSYHYRDLQKAHRAEGEHALEPAEERPNEAAAEEPESRT